MPNADSHDAARHPPCPQALSVEAADDTRYPEAENRPTTMEGTGMIIALSIIYDEGTFGVHYAAARTLDQANRWIAQRKQALDRQGTENASAVLNTDHIQQIDECNVDEADPA
jgi:hypothetical protein